MSATTLNLPFKRYVAQVSTGAPRPKSTYLSLMAENLEALKACPWREATDVPVALADHDFTKATHLSDAYDAFKMTGNWNATDQTEVAYAGMAAYRFKIPASALGGSPVAITSVSLPISRDRFLKGGVRIAYELTSRATPSDDWDTVRGGESPAASAYLSNPAAYLTAAKPADGTKAVDLSGVDSGNPSAYLWIYVTLEDYTDWWDKYTASEARQYAIEGSAMLVGGSASVTFAGDVTPDAEGTVTLLSGGSSPTWLQPLPTVNVGTDAPPVPEAPFAEYFFTAERTETTPIENSVSGICQPFDSAGNWPFTITFLGKTVTSVVVGGVSLSRYTGSSDWIGWSSAYRLYVNYVNFSDDAEPNYTRISYKVTVSIPNTSGISSHTQGWNNSELYLYQTVRSYYYMLELVDGAPVAVDVVDLSPDPANRRNFESNVTVVTADTKWSVAMATPTTTISFSVVKAGATVTLYNVRNAVMGTWQSDYSDSPTFFDAAVAAWLDNETAQNYGVAAALGDFSAAVATFEAGTQPDNAEVLGRLARMARKRADAMAYLHPASGALAEELDVLRPVPRFFRTGSAPPTQTACQPGLSVWYYRPHTTAGSPAVTTITPSSAEKVLAYRDGAVASVTKVADPVFLQLSLLALRAPAAFADKLVLKNVGQNAVDNPFRLRFVAWVSPAGEWDGSNAFAMAAMGSMPSVYRSNGEGSVSWSVDCSGSLMPLGTRAMTAQRIGVSEVVAGNIAANGSIDIPLDGKVGEGDVLLIAPEVIGFADGAEGVSVHFGRQSTPSASANNGAWARYAQDLGWFPQVTGE